MLAKSFFCEQVEVVGLAPGSPKMGRDLKLEHLGGRDLNFSAVSIHFAFWGRWIWGSRACTDVWESDPLGGGKGRGKVFTCSRHQPIPSSEGFA